MSKRIAIELLRIAKSLLAAEVFYNDADGGLYMSLRSMVKSNNGLWKSPAQGNYILKQLGSHSLPTDIQHVDKAVSMKPHVPGLQGLILTETSIGHDQGWGKHVRRMVYFYWVDKFGIVKEIKCDVEYDGGWSGIKDAHETWSRPADLQKELEAKGVEDKPDPWFEQNKEQIKMVETHLQHDDFWKKAIADLQRGLKPSDKSWQMMLDKATHQESVKDAAPFPTTETKMTIELRMKSWKDAESEFQGHVTSKVALIGDIVGFKEVGYITLGQDTLRNLVKPHMSINQDEMQDEYSEFRPTLDKLKGKTFKLVGTFKSNGKMVFGKRVKIVSIS